MAKLTSDQKMVSCYYCDSYQIWAAKPKTNIYYCNNSDCKKAFCTLCDGLVDNNRDERKTEEDEIKYEKKLHPTWAKYAEMRNEWDMILERGAMRFCPNPSCKARWVKDTDCTHMKWFTWGTNYCYFWGKAEADWNKSDPKGGMARHNDDWNTNPKRCPLLLISIQDIDPKWEANKDDTCMAMFHQLLTYNYITDFIDKHGNKKFKLFCSAFNILEKDGIDIDEIQNTDNTMISRLVDFSKLK